MLPSRETDSGDAAPAPSGIHQRSRTSSCSTLIQGALDQPFYAGAPALGRGLELPGGGEPTLDGLACGVHDLLWCGFVCWSRVVSPTSARE
jgi:hypothetical protein